jgi:hypothetical protein
VCENEQISNKVIMYFVEKHEANQATATLRSIIRCIEDWPKGFFDEMRSAAAILRAGMEKRRSESKKRHG